MDRVVLLTGAASGLGRAAAEHLATRGHRVYGGDLRPDPVPGVTMLMLDVTDEESCRQAVGKIVAEEGRLDVVVNNAGFGIAGAIEDTSLEEARSQLEVNFFGGFTMTRAALPQMRRQHYGLIVNVSSIGGVIGLPFQGLYSASKFAIEGLSEALQAEVRSFGIDVVLVEPADFATGFTAARRPVAAAGPDSPYADAFAAALGVMEADERGGSDPGLVGPLLHRIITARHPRARYLVGSRTERLAPLVKRVLPGRLFAPIIDSHYGLRR